jgi:hypothetical protein
MLTSLTRMFRSILARLTGGKRRRWAPKTLVIGPSEPVDGDSVASTKALLNHLRKQGLEAFTLPVLAMYDQIQFVLAEDDLHPSCHELATERLTTTDLQAAFDALTAVWRPDEIVLVDGQKRLLGFDPGDVPVYIIDHHLHSDDDARDDAEAYIQPSPSAGCLLIKDFGIYEPILTVSILTDTYWLRQNSPADAVECLEILRVQGVLDNDELVKIQRQLKVPKKTKIIMALQECEFHPDGDAVFAVLKTPDPEVHRGVMADLGYYFKHICVVRADGYVSFRTTDTRIDLRPLADRWGGGGHFNMAAGRIKAGDTAAIYRVQKDFLKEVGHERK